MQLVWLQLLQVFAAGGCSWYVDICPPVVDGHAAMEYEHMFG
jgi:hypothetical protein